MKMYRTAFGLNLV